MNESTTTASSKEEESSFKTLQDILHNRIIQKKGEMHESHNRKHTDNLWKEIETLHWVLAQILTLKKIYNSKSRDESTEE